LQSAAFGTETPTRAAADSVARVVGQVFQSDEYTRIVQKSLWDRFWEWIWDLVGRFISSLLKALSSVPGAELAVSILMYGIAAIVVLTILYYTITYLRTRHRGERVDDNQVIRNLRTAADQAAARGDYLEATDLLYGALLHAFVVRGWVRFHPSKTAGDYARELRQRRGETQVSFRNFVRAYEVIIYRHGTCDQAQYDALRALAEPVFRPTQAAA
jgi:hypothetical protein